MIALRIKKELKTIDTGNKFLILGDKKYFKDPANKTFLKDKLAKTDKSYNENMWGTLGNFDKSQIRWKGKLMHSRLGSDKSVGITRELKQILIEATGTINLKEEEITERFISFDKIKFPGQIENHGPLRLTLFLNPDEGAVVYYQHFEKEETNPKKGKHLGYDYDIIPPEATKDKDGQVDYNTNKRDRLNYEIDILPKIIKSDIRDDELEKRQRFVVKILTFKRNAASNENIVQKTEEKVFGSNKRYELLVFDKENDQFVAPKKGKNNIDPDLKTLFLIHGTFVDTANSYEAILFKSDNNPSLLKKYLTDENSKHQQAIAFNHPTMFDDARENTGRLMEELDKFQPGFVFKKQLDLVGTSRGALLAKFLAIEHEKNQGENPKIPVDKIITVSGANGCGYLTKGKYYVNALLKLCKNGTPLQKILVSLAQLSASYITSRSGLQLMTPGNSKLEDILEYKPGPQSICQVLTLCADIQVMKANKIGKKLKNFVLRIGDKVVQRLLGKQHDFVIGTIEQGIADPFPKVDLSGNILFNAVHGKVLDIPEAWPLIVKYLNQ